MRFNTKRCATNSKTEKNIDEFSSDMYVLSFRFHSKQIVHIT